MRISKNHNSLGCEQPLGLDVKQSPDAQDAFQPIPGLISYAGATGNTDNGKLTHSTSMRLCLTYYLHNALGFHCKNFLKVFWSLVKSNPCFNSLSVRLDDL